MTKKTRIIRGDPAYSEELHITTDTDDFPLIEAGMTVVELKIFSSGESLSADFTYEEAERIVTALQNALKSFKR